jgi:hypothetical protein
MQPFSTLHRRAFLNQASYGFGAAALAHLLGNDASASVPGVLGSPLFAPKAKRVIFLSMAGGPSHLETFDYKPVLGQMDGKPMPESMTKGQQIAQLQGQALKCFAPQHPFQKYGKSGQEFSSLLPQLGKMADDMCIIRSVYSEAINHDPAHMFMNTGSQIAGRPSMGAWATYGLGSEAQNLPGFVVLTSLGRGGQNQPIAARQWSSGFLPSRNQGVHLRGKGDPVMYLNAPPGINASRQFDAVKAINQLNGVHDAVVHDPEIATRIAQYEMAFKMQSSVPELMDLSKEPASVLELYGCKPGDGSFAYNCLLARRLAERGVRFIQLYHKDWDHHGDIKQGIVFKAEEIDRACMALLSDLKQRGLLDDTLVIWGGEFGRTPMSQGNGRDHHNKGFSIWMAGGGVKGGMVYGETDDFGYNIVKDPVSVHDFHATVLHLLGINHEQMTYKHLGRRYRLTDIAGQVVNGILS